MQQFIKHRAVLYSLVAILIFSMQILFLGFNLSGSVRDSDSVRNQELKRVKHHKIQTRALSRVDQYPNCEHSQTDHGQIICLNSDNCCHYIGMISMAMQWGGMASGPNKTDIKPFSYHIFPSPQMRPPQFVG